MTDSPRTGTASPRRSGCARARFSGARAESRQPGRALARQPGLVLSQAVDDAALAWLHVLAELPHVVAAGVHRGAHVGAPLRRLFEERLALRRDLVLVLLHAAVPVGAGLRVRAEPPHVGLARLC